MSRDVVLIGSGMAALLSAFILQEEGIDFSWFATESFDKERFESMKYAGPRYLHPPSDGDPYYRSFLDLVLGSWTESMLTCRVLYGDRFLSPEEFLSIGIDSYNTILSIYARKTGRDFIEPNLMNQFGSRRPALYGVAHTRLYRGCHDSVQEITLDRVLCPFRTYGMFLDNILRGLGNRIMDIVVLSESKIQDILDNPTGRIIIFCDKVQKFFEIPKGEESSKTTFIIGELTKKVLFDRSDRWFVYIPDRNVLAHRVTSNGRLCIEVPRLLSDKELIVSIKQLERYGFELVPGSIEVHRVNTVHPSEEQKIVAKELVEDLSRRNIFCVGRASRFDRSKINDMVRHMFHIIKNFR